MDMKHLNRIKHIQQRVVNAHLLLTFNGYLPEYPFGSKNVYYNGREVLWKFPKLRDIWLSIQNISVLCCFLHKYTMSPDPIIMPKRKSGTKLAIAINKPSTPERQANKVTMK